MTFFPLFLTLFDGKCKIMTFWEEAFFGFIITAIHLSLEKERELLLLEDVSLESFSGDL